MKVIAWFKDGSFRVVEIPETKWSRATPLQATEYVKTVFSKSEREQVDRWEVEEDFL